jgi:hypothetical protein
MAKRKTKSSKSRAVVVRTASAKPIIIRQNSGSIAKRSAPRRRSSGGGGGHINNLLSNERTGAMVGAAVLGVLDKQGTKFPTIPMVGRAGTAGLLLWWLGKSQRSPQLAHAATGCLAIAVYEMAKDGKISGDGVDGMSTI